MVKKIKFKFTLITLVFIAIIILIAMYFNFKVRDEDKSIAVLNNKALELYEKAEYDSAIFYYKKVVPLLNYSKDGEKLIEIQNNLAYSLICVRKFDDALEILNTNFDNGIKQFGNKNKHVITTLNYLGITMHNSGNYDQSLKYFHQTLELRKEIPEANKIDIADSYNNLGIAYKSSGNYGQSLKYLMKSLILLEEIYGEDHPELLEPYINIGNTYNYKGEYDMALEYHKKAIDIIMNIPGPDSSILAVCFMNIGNVYLNTGEYDLALSFFLKNLDLKVNKFGVDHPDISGSYNNLGNLYNKTGKYDIALEYYQKSLNLRIKSYTEYHPLIADSYYNIGNIYFSKTEYDLALEYYQKAKRIRETVLNNDHPAQAQTLKSIGNVFLQNGLFKKALSNYLKALDIVKQNTGKKHPEVAEGYLNISNAFYEYGKFDIALEYAFNALNIYKSLQGEYRDKTIAIYSNIATIFDVTHNYSKANEYHILALQTGQKIFPEKHPALARFCNNYANSFNFRGNYYEALKYYQKAIVFNTYNFSDSTNVLSNPVIADFSKNKKSNFINPGDLVLTLHLKAKTFDIISQKRKDVDYLRHSLETFEVCDSLIDIIRFSFYTAKDKIALGQLIEDIYCDAIKVCYKLYNTSDTSGNMMYLEKAFYFAEKSKAMVLLGLVNETNAKIGAGIPDSLLKKEIKIKNDLACYSAELQKEKFIDNTPDVTKINHIENIIFGLNRQYENLLKTFENDYQEYYKLKYNTNVISAGKIQEYLDDKTIILEYFLHNTSLYIFSIRKDNISFVHRKIEDDDQILARNFYHSINNYSFEEYTATSRLLYKTFLLPVEKNLTDIEKLVIIPHDYLHYVPFEALTDEISSSEINFADLNYLVKKFRISYNYSASLWSKNMMKEMNETKHSFIGFAPAFDDKEKDNFVSIDNLGFNPIPHAKEEVKEIVDMFTKKGFEAEGYFNDKASEKSFKKNIKPYNCIHVATHGFYNDKFPGLSFLAFSQIENKSKSLNKSFSERETEFLNDDGILRMPEMYNLNINAGLVVLSACETGTGNIMKGEGIMAMTRGFLHSGAENIIYTLWSVDDKITKQFMLSFYSKILSEKTYDEALRLSKLEIINNPKTSFPRNWSGYILLGR